MSMKTQAHGIRDFAEVVPVKEFVPLNAWVGKKSV